MLQLLEVDTENSPFNLKPKHVQLLEVDTENSLFNLKPKHVTTTRG